jgi:hypothetical protein
MIRTIAPVLAAVVLVVVLVVGLGRSTRAQPDEGPSVVYLFVSGDGPSATAWYSGAPPTGEPVQDALDRFPGYRVATTTASERPTAITIARDDGTVSDIETTPQSYLVLLER